MRDLSTANTVGGSREKKKIQKYDKPICFPRPPDGNGNPRERGMENAFFLLLVSGERSAHVVYNRNSLTWLGVCARGGVCLRGCLPREHGKGGEEVERSVILFLTDNRQGEAEVTHVDIYIEKNICVVRELRKFFLQ